MSPDIRHRLAAFFLSALLLATSCQRDVPATSGHAALVDALGSRRLVIPRLTGGFRYAPPEDAKTPLTTRERRDLSKAAAVIRRKRSLHAGGILALLSGRSEQAVLLLERAAAKSPRNAEIFSDLAAAYLVRAESLDQPIDLIAALDAAEAAAALDPKSLEARFNRALTRERLSLSTQAVRSWREYLGREKDPGWSGEARAALAHLQPSFPAETWPDAKARLLRAVRKRDQKTVTALVARFPQEARTFAEEEVLGAWADHFQQGDTSGADDDLATARAIGHGLVQTSGESLLADSVAGIERALHGDPTQLGILIEGLVAYQKGFRLIQERKFGLAEAPLERADELLRQATSPLAAWASFLLVRCAYQRPDYVEVEKRAHALLRDLDIAKYPVVAARTRWVLGTAQMGLARPAEALDSYRFALVQFERTQESIHRAAVHSLLSGVFDELGDVSSAWHHRALALHGLADRRDPERLRVILTNVAFAALDSGYPRAALMLQTEAVEIAESRNHAERHANTLQNRAAILDLAGLADPQKDLASARHDCERIEDPSIRQSILSDLLAIEGRWLSRKAPLRALAPLGRALEMYREAGRQLMLPGVLQTRAEALQRLGRIAEAEADLRNAIEVLEEERGSVPGGEHRASFSDRKGGAFDSMVLLQTERGHPDLALEYSERRRARLLLDWLSALPKDLDARRFRLETWTHPLPLQELRKRIPAGAVAVVYEVLPDQLLIWIVRSSGVVEQRQVRVSAVQVAERVRRLDQAFSGSEDRLRQAGAALHELLVQPIAGLLRGDETVVFVPEGPLGSVPFALLLDPRTGRYLIEDRLFAIAPSLNLFAHLLDRHVGESFADADVVVLANPAFDQALFPLPPLPGADEEGRWVRDLYPEARIVSGALAGREVLLEELGQTRILHFGGHALANSQKPFLSSLLLAPRPARGDSGVLYARELIGTPDGGTDLVILSACRSAGGAAAGEGVAGLVWPFFSRGVPSVIASTRAVEDRAAAAVFAAFYRHLARGVPPIEALRKAQLEMLAANRRIYHPSFDWAAFQLYGAAHSRQV